MKMLGFLAFIIGFILAIVAGLFFPDNAVVIIILLILGLLIGFLNIGSEEMVPLLLATIALVVVGNVFSPIETLNIGDKLGDIMALIAALMAPAAIVVAVKTLYTVAKPH
ncbi:MAG: hypothetical protein JW954_00095 [Dehalococcoidaceae bacterium]|nr:hypothetical protein [Dehalococcoidaceae bacterium]